MKKILLFIFCLGISLSAFSKNIFDSSSSESEHKNIYADRVYALSVGSFQGNFFGLNNYIKQFGTSPGFNSYFQTVGINFVWRKEEAETGNATMNFEAMIPQHITEGDSFKLKMSGWHLMTSLFAYNFLPNKQHVAFEIAPGIDWGQLYLSKKVLNAANIYKNIFVAPLARAEVRVVLPPFCFGVRALYRYDITNPDWKLQKAFPTVFGASRIYGFGFQFFIGYGKITS